MVFILVGADLDVEVLGHVLGLSWVLRSRQAVLPVAAPLHVPISWEGKTGAWGMSVAAAVT